MARIWSHGLAEAPQQPPVRCLDAHPACWRCRGRIPADFVMQSPRAWKQERCLLGTGASFAASTVPQYIGRLWDPLSCQSGAQRRSCKHIDVNRLVCSWEAHQLKAMTIRYICPKLMHEHINVGDRAREMMVLLAAAVTEGQIRPTGLTPLPLLPPRPACLLAECQPS